MPGRPEIHCRLLGPVGGIGCREAAAVGSVARQLLVIASHRGRTVIRMLTDSAG
jgi:hypothetical protein